MYDIQKQIIDKNSSLKYIRYKGNAMQSWNTTVARVTSKTALMQ